MTPQDEDRLFAEANEGIGRRQRMMAVSRAFVDAMMSTMVEERDEPDAPWNRRPWVGWLAWLAFLAVGIAIGRLT
jgi:hypothetical protein